MVAPVRPQKQPRRPGGRTFRRRDYYRKSRRPADPVKRTIAATIVLAAVLGGLYLAPHILDKAIDLAAESPYADTLLEWLPRGRTRNEPVVLRPSERTVIPARPMPICWERFGADCVVDGDTIRVDGEKIRLDTIDAPELHGHCALETDLAVKATRRLQALLSGHRMTILRKGLDVYGRTLARVSTDRGEVGGILADEGLARRAIGHREPWC